MLINNKRRILRYIFVMLFSLLIITPIVFGVTRAISNVQSIKEEFGEKYIIIATENDRVLILVLNENSDDDAFWFKMKSDSRVYDKQKVSEKELDSILLNNK